MWSAADVGEPINDVILNEEDNSETDSDASEPLSEATEGAGDSNAQTDLNTVKQLGIVREEFAATLQTLTMTDASFPAHIQSHRHRLLNFKFCPRGSARDCKQISHTGSRGDGASLGRCHQQVFPTGRRG